MIKIILKHFIAEQAIDAFFNGLISSFMSPEQQFTGLPFQEDGVIWYEWIDPLTNSKIMTIGTSDYMFIDGRGWVDNNWMEEDECMSHDDLRKCLDQIKGYY